MNMKNGLSLKTSSKLVRYIFYFIVLLLVSTVFLMAFDETHWNSSGAINHQTDQSIIQAFINRLYFLSTTISTSGYGDITPVSNSLKLTVVFIQIIVTIGVIDILLHL